MNHQVFLSFFQDSNEYVYELFSIMIHSGSALGGHYYAYIRLVFSHWTGQYLIQFGIKTHLMLFLILIGSPIKYHKELNSMRDYYIDLPNI